MGGIMRRVKLSYSHIQELSINTSLIELRCILRYLNTAQASVE